VQTNKVYTDGKGPKYGYTQDGKLAQRIWARGIVTDYSYDGWGSLTNTVYSDGTPTVTLFYDAMGRQTNAVDAAGVTTFGYDDFGSLTNETVVGAAGENTIIRHWDVYGRTAGYSLVGRVVPNAPQGEVEEFIPQFDDDGNQTLIQTSTGVWSVQYNGENRPVLWTGGTQSAATNIVMSFDRMGRRMEYREIQTTGASGGNTPTTTVNTHHSFVYDDYLCIQRLDAANGNAVDLAFVWDVNEPVATRPLVVDKPEVYQACVTHDGNKNVAELFSDNYQVFTHYEYSPFGDVAVSTQTTSAQSVNLRTCNPYR